MTKRELRKREIIEQAFSTWSTEHFAHTSLNSVAKAMGMTKPALYRYFSNKEALLEEMRSYFAELFDSLCDDALQKVEEAGEETGRPFEAVFDGYNESIIRFFAENPEYFAYAMLLYLPREKASSEETEHVSTRYRELFTDRLLSEDLNREIEDARTVRNFIVTVGGFFLSRMVVCDSKPIVEELNSLLSRNKSIVFHGFGNRERLEAVDYEKIEKSCIVGPEDLLEPDHIFTAIAEVVAEHGLWNASLDKIARKAGMRKSSLYFYFENRNDMLWKMIDRERHRVGNIFVERSGGRRKPEERLYAYFSIFGGYMAMRPDFLSVMNWFRIQRINLKVPEHAKEGMRNYVRFLDENIKEGKIQTRGLDVLELVRFIHFIVVNEINQDHWSGISAVEVQRRFRLLFELFLYGVEGE